MSQRLSNWASIAEIVSAIAVVAGLVFVGLEIRQNTQETALNTRALEVSAHQDLISQIMDINLAKMTDTGLLDIVERGKDGELTDPIEETGFFQYEVTLTRHADMACFQFQRGMISAERLAAILAIFIAEIYQPLGYEGDPPWQESAFPGLAECVEVALARSRA